MMYLNEELYDVLGDEVKENNQETKQSHPLKKIYGQFEGYMSQVPVIGFNSAKYDLNLIKRTVAKHLHIHDTKQTGIFVVKKNNAYACIATESLKFLDMSHFLAPGSSYAGFLKAFRVEQAKGYFCYDWFDSVEKLEYPSLPSHTDFYSELKGKNISKDAYEYCQKAWKENNVTFFRDFFICYNNLDVGPFVTAVERFQAFYFEKVIDVFKTSISIPGISRQLLFRTAKQQKVNFALFDKGNSDLFQTIKHNIVGGPSIIFTRHHCAGKTLIQGKKKCGSILGFDANALYLQAIGQEMPVSSFIRRRFENDFRPDLRDKYMAAYYWMNWLMHTYQHIQHRLNSGREVRIEKYPVNGYATPTTLG